MIGKILANYEVLEKIGEGGMGEVYRARDTTLGREVALKLLPAHLVSDPDRVLRFEREAKVLASLNHPGIASIYGFHEQDGVRFLAMELAPGPDLSEQIGQGPINIEDALVLAGKIAEALEYAHERNIVHRDLKPSNVKASQGAVKVLDFGLAKAFAPEGKDGEPTSTPTLLPTVTSGGTGAGIVLGTAAYMSPEQARGHQVDRRTDIWAFGCVLYEMLTGERTFNEETISDTLAAVLRAEIDLSRLPEKTPPAVRHLLERCLDRDPKTRLRDIGEARILLGDPEASTAMRIVAAEPAPPPARTRLGLAVVVTAIAALALGLGGGKALFTTAPAPPQPSFLFDIRDTTNTLVTGSLALSPSGSHLVFSRMSEEGTRELCIRRLDQDAFRVIPGTENARFPFWSPDGTEIGFFVERTLYRIDLDGGAPRAMTELPDRPMGGTWNQNGVILAGTYNGPLMRIDVSGGEPESLTTVVQGEENAHVWPAFLPDGEHFVFLADASDDDGHRLYVKSLDLKESRILRKALRSAIAVDPAGALLVIHDRQLLGLPFDFDRLELEGPSILIANEIQTIGQRHETAFAFSQNGVLALQRGSDEAMILRLPLDGSPREALTEPGRYRNPRLSPDGTSVAYEIQISGSERLVWVHDLETDVQTLVSNRGILSDSPAWSADGEWIYFGAQGKDDIWRVFRKRIAGGGLADDLGIPPDCIDLSVEDGSRVGPWILVTAQEKGGAWGLYLGHVQADTVAWTTWINSPAAEERSRFSPDGKWIAFRSDASGREEIYVAPLEGGPMVKQWRVSTNGGTDPAWSPDGSRLYYVTPSSVLMAVPVSVSGGEFRAGRPEPILELNTPEVGYLRNAYHPAPDGKSLIAFQDATQSAPAIRIRTGWREW